MRALRVLREEVAAIACEDTRQTQKLLHHFEIRKPLVSYHEHNEAARAGEIVARLAAGESIALVTDAGTPLISDPGYRVVTAAIEAGCVVTPLPGASAMLTALAGSGMPVDNFRFVGFVPSKKQARRLFLQGLEGEDATVIAYESPHRILESLSDAAELLGPRRMALARELTKVHEEFLRGSAAEILAVLQARAAVKGEITLVIGRAEAQAPALEDAQAAVAQLESEGMARMEAIKTVAKRLGVSKREVYRLFS